MSLQRQNKPNETELETLWLNIERKMAERELASLVQYTNPSLATRRQICDLKCRLWVIKGVLDKGLD